MERIPAVNPGATSPLYKFAVLQGETVLVKKTVEHHGDELKAFSRVFDQYPYRIDLLRRELAEAGIELSSLHAAGYAAA